MYFNSFFGGYHPSDIDDTDGVNPKYFGFVDKEGNWYILQLHETNGALRYAKGENDYITNWTNRATLIYDYFHNIFS